MKKSADYLILLITSSFAAAGVRAREKFDLCARGDFHANYSHSGVVNLFADEPLYRGIFRTTTRPLFDTILFNGVC